MNIKEVKDLIHEILQSDISEFELEHTGTKLRMRRGTSGEALAASAQIISIPKAAPAKNPAPVDVPPAPQSAAVEQSSDDGLHIITSPIVGTFYRSPSPGAEPFVKIGQMVEEGSTLCIVEAMKLMNEIPSDVAGEVARIFVENSNPVEYGQKLFGIRPRV